MTQSEAIDFSNDDVWALWAPLMEAVRPKGKTAPQDLRRTLSAIVWRHTNGTKWRSVPPHLGPWWRAAQLSIRWSKLGVWQRLLDLCQERGLSLGLVYLDGTVIRAHQKASGAEKRMARPVGKWFLGSSLICLHKRIRPSGEPLAKMESRASWSS